MVVMLRLALISEGGIIRLVDRPVLLLVICFVAVGLCVGDDEEDLVDRANEREPVMLKGGRMRERERGPRPPFQGHSCLLKYHLDLGKKIYILKNSGRKRGRDRQ